MNDHVLRGGACLSPSRSNHLSGLRVGRSIISTDGKGKRKTRRSHLNSLASAPQMSVDRLMAAIPSDTVGQVS